MSEIQTILSTIQTELHAPKDKYNAFGKFSYRSCEGILEALKPHLSKHGATLIIWDEAVCVGDRNYIKATADLCHEGSTISATAYAREPLVKKGMDEAQITGATSSYARKYALNGLFCIDDSQDPDTEESKQEDAVLKGISECTTLGDLQTFWSGLTKELHKHYAGHKDARKAQLGD